MSTTTTTTKQRITMERTYAKASIDDVWDLWTTKDGIESWWGPDGFAVEVRKLDLRNGGELLYAMKAVAGPQIEFMKKAGMPLVTEAKITYTEVKPRERLAYVHLTDFIPGVEPYDVATVIELSKNAAGGVKMVLSFDAMHDETWTQRASAGWESGFGKLEKLLVKRAG